MSTSDPLDNEIRRLARTPVLLIATDYDGTLAPIVADPERATPHREAIIAIRQLSELPATHTAIISGRALRDLAHLTGSPDRVRLVGSHGSEFDAGFADSLPPEAAALRQRIIEQLNAAADRGTGFAVETKPASVAFHYRNADPDLARPIVTELLAGPGALDGVHVKHGKMVVEFAVISTNKGAALDTVRHRVGATATLFIGDDATDEDAFHILRGPDLGIKVGDGPTAAPFRIQDTEAVARLLAQLCEHRAAWATGGASTPIEAHSMLSDLRTVALVAPGARINWLCCPRIDSPAIFADLLGGPSAGHFTIEPADPPADPPTVEYGQRDLTLRTRWPGITVTDYLDCSGSRFLQRAGRSDLLRCITGDARVRIEFAPRLDFGRVPTRLEVAPDALIIEDTVDPIVLRAPGVQWNIHREGSHHTAIATVQLQPDEPLILELRYGTGGRKPAVISEQNRREQTTGFWNNWTDQLKLPERHRDAILRSALTLRALTHGPTGAIAAAATTSLPEWIGGVRNWDYRYCWPRDASLSASALVRLGSTTEAIRFLDWLLAVVDQLPSPDRLSPIYTVSGGILGPEAEIPELCGYAGSRPVRVGNAASRQLQLDVFGPIVELIHLLMLHGAPLSGEHWRLVSAMIDAVAARWNEPDHGIWEIRGPRQHHVHSKVMCWQAASHAIEIAESLAGKARNDWIQLRDEIAADLLEHGWNESLGSFASYYGANHVDAGVLSIGLCGLLEPDDPRFAGTIRRIESELLEGTTVKRYRYDDGLPGAEGGFHLCTAWLIMAYARSGRTSDAQALFDAFLAARGPTGLLPEEIDPDTGHGLGNHPQAYSHLALIEAALAIEAANNRSRA
ncbi:MAG: trehalose-phosphatase [Phycisphaerales bacterium]